MTEESLADYVTRLEQENEEIYENGQIEITRLCNEKTKYRSALEEIKQYMKNASKATTEEEAHQEFRKVVSKIDEVLE